MMLRVIRAIASKHHATTWSTTMIASAYGPSPWRGCVPVVEFRPRYAPNGLAPLPERPVAGRRTKRTSRAMRDYDAMSELLLS
jgi:hypothetical protein